MKQKFIEAYMDVAERFALLSTAKRAQVGAIIVKDNRIISIGYNGTPGGWDNQCEDIIKPDWMDWEPNEEDLVQCTLKTRPEVLHAESNALSKVARSPESSEGAVIFCTHLPCIECAKQIYQAGITAVYYRIEYAAAKGHGKEFLDKSGIQVIQV